MIWIYNQECIVEFVTFGALYFYFILRQVRVTMGIELMEFFLLIKKSR